MKKFKNLMLWYYMFNKRLLHRYSFILILVLIPILVPALKIAMSGDSSILKVALVSNGSESAEEIISSLAEEKGVIKYIIYDTEEEAEKSVKLQKTDAAWIFGENFDEELKDYAKDKAKKPIISVIEREDNIAEKLSRIQLFGSVFPKLSYELFKDFVYNNVISPEEIPEKYLEKYYNTDSADGNIVEIKTFNDQRTSTDSNYLTAPFRGILSILIIFAGISGAMMFLSDQTAGKYDWLSPRKRIVPAVGLSLASVSLTSVVVFVALILSGFVKNIWIEILAMMLFVISATLFSMIFAVVFRSPGKLGALMPFLVLLMIVLCPIFFSIDAVNGITMLLPPYYYLNAINDSRFLLYMLIYNIALYLVVTALNCILNKRARHISYLG